jgi:hypothetical protein
MRERLTLPHSLRVRVPDLLPAIETGRICVDFRGAATSFCRVGAFTLIELLRLPVYALVTLALLALIG